MRERNPPRNSQPETHPDDERGRGRNRSRLHRIDRFPDALKTHEESCREAASLLYRSARLRSNSAGGR